MIPPQVPSLDIDAYDLVQLRISLSILDKSERILMRFTDEVAWVAMRSAGARKLAKLLLDKADELDKLYPEIVQEEERSPD